MNPVRRYSAADVPSTWDWWALLWLGIVSLLAGPIGLSLVVLYFDDLATALSIPAIYAVVLGVLALLSWIAPAAPGRRLPSAFIALGGIAVPLVWVLVESALRVGLATGDAGFFLVFRVVPVSLAVAWMTHRGYPRVTWAWLGVYAVWFVVYLIVGDPAFNLGVLTGMTTLILGYVAEPALALIPANIHARRLARARS